MAPYDNDLTSPTCAAPAGWYGEEFDIEIPKTGWYFFYGTLRDPATLAEVIIGSQGELPKLHPARIDGYETMLWGSRAALVKGVSDVSVRGSAFKIETTTQARRLQGYATDAFKVESCKLRLEDGEGQDSVVDGQTLVWDGPQDELKQGQFDLREFQMSKLEQDISKQN